MRMRAPLPSTSGPPRQRACRREVLLLAILRRRPPRRRRYPGGPSPAQLQSARRLPLQPAGAKGRSTARRAGRRTVPISSILLLCYAIRRFHGRILARLSQRYLRVALLLRGRNEAQVVRPPIPVLYKHKLKSNGQKEALIYRFLLNLAIPKKVNFDTAWSYGYRTNYPQKIIKISRCFCPRLQRRKACRCRWLRVAGIGRRCKPISWRGRRRADGHGRGVLCCWEQTGASPRRRAGLREARS